MSTPPKATRHHNSTKLLILLPLRAIQFRPFQYDTPCRFVVSEFVTICDELNHLVHVSSLTGGFFKYKHGLNLILILNSLNSLKPFSVSNIHHFSNFQFFDSFDCCSWYEKRSGNKIKDKEQLIIGNMYNFIGLFFLHIFNKRQFTYI